ncbi:type IV toxin-antitoxin system AbiEi family antitoxin [Pedobacter sp. GR22-6]|uniref:type IV toxin-antitoxin system AbiEi family antitoxin n=1 Tax=Pedobacter sp. GR22-6 TaxID=3127957 RepID=UPI00307CF1D8
MIEQNLLFDALEKLKGLTAIDYAVKPNVFHMGEGQVVTLVDDKIHSNFAAEVKSVFLKEQLPALVKRFAHPTVARHLLVSKYIPKPLKQTLKEKEICYLEASGNCFIRARGLYVYINDQPVTEVRQTAEGKLWNVAGLKFLFGVLQQPELLNAPYRTIARQTKVALGTVGPLIEELEAEGFMKVNKGLKNKKVKFLDQRDRLLERWATLYYANLRPKLIKGAFRFMNPKARQHWKDITTEGFLWGGENAGAVLTNFLDPELFSIYTKEKPLELMKKLKLVPDQKGELVMVEQFWDQLPHQSDANGAVPPLIAYAELINSMDSRCHETAVRIKKRYLNG